MQYVLITGASTGIGHATSKYLIDKGYFVIGSVRKAADAKQLEEEFGDAFKAVVFDVTDAKAIKESFSYVKNIVGDSGLFGLINNAGIAVAGPLQYLKMESFEHQMNVNVNGLLRTTQTFLPLLGGNEWYKNSPGRIINIGSVSGIIGSPFLGAYCASKFAVEAISDSLRRELKLHGIKVVLLQPGPIKTRIWGKSTQIDPDLFETEYAPFLNQVSRSIEKTEAAALEAIELGKLILKTLTIKNPKPRYMISGNKRSIQFAALLPDRWLDNIFFKQMNKVLEREKRKKDSERKLEEE
jgi:short-subunit dehydrogenase